MDRKNKNKQLIAYKFIRSKIIDGSYPPGSKLVITRIAQELSLSPIPVREAIRRLEADNLIEMRPYSGAIVAAINEDEYLEILTVIAVLEGYAVHLGLPYFKERDLEQLQIINEEARSALEDFEFYQFGKANRKFHQLTISYCTNKYLLNEIEEKWSKLDTIRHMGAVFFPARAKESIKEHQHIINLISEQNNEIDLYIRNHHLNAIESYKKRKNNYPTP